MKNKDVRERLRTEEPYKSVYGNLTDGRLGKLIRAAGDPNNNCFLKHLELDDVLQRYVRQYFEQKGNSWSPVLEQWTKRMAEVLQQHLAEPAVK